MISMLDSVATISLYENIPESLPLVSNRANEIIDKSTFYRVPLFTLPV